MDGGKARAQYTSPSYARRRSREEPTRNAGTLETRKCVECGGVGHLAQECPTRLSRQNSRNPPKGNSANAQKQQPPPDQQRVKARKNEQASGNE
jgi:hypothetical protein